MSFYVCSLDLDASADNINLGDRSGVEVGVKMAV